VGRYELLNSWEVIYNLLTQHTDLPARFIDLTQWASEASLYLDGFAVSAGYR